DPPVSEIVRTPPGARRRLDLALRRTEGGVTVGLHEAWSTRVIDVHSCLVMHPALLGLLNPLRDVLPLLDGLRRMGSAIVNLLDSGPDLLLGADAVLSA